MDLAVGMQQKGTLDAAEELYRRILTVVPTHVDALHLLGLCRHLRKDIDGALELVRRSVDLAPTHVDAHEDLVLPWSVMAWNRRAATESIN
jgi:Flp pilus assembly protein TadD